MNQNLQNGSLLFWDPHYKPCCECHEGEGNRCLGNARVVQLLSMHRAVATVVDDQTWESANLNGYDEVVFTRNMETIEAFSSCVISIKVEKAYTGEHINVMTQALWTKGGSLPQGLTVQNVYTELQKGSKNIVMVVRNSMAYPRMLQKKAPVARAVAATMVPEMPPEIRVQEGEDGPQDPHPPSLTTRQRQGKLFEKLYLSGLKLWPLELGEAACQLLAKYYNVFFLLEPAELGSLTLPPELAEAACQLLAKYHNVFLLEHVELGCTHSTKHMIKVTDDTTFKE